MGARRSRTFFFVRVSILLGILAVILLWAWNDRRRRTARTTWARPLQVALILTTQGEVDAVAVANLKGRIRDLERHLLAERRLYRSDATNEPFAFQVYGPVAVHSAPPKPSAEGFVALLQQTYGSWRYFRGVDGQLDVPWRAFDARLYLMLRPPASAHRKSIEGQSEQGGWVGQVEVELDESMVDFALFVVVHELMHLLGASDKYDPSGRALVPEGLADPLRQPLFPQTRAEIMARNIVVAPGTERPPDTLDELCIGALTAEEIGWR